MTVFCIIIIALYVATLASFLIGYGHIKQISFSKKHKTTIGFSVVIPFRNEAKHLPELFKSINQLNYPQALAEFILVNDESTDESVALVENFIKTSTFSIKLLQRDKKSSSPKKDAITSAIKIAKFNWIVTTDADCLLPINWLLAYNNFITNNDVDLVASSVKLEGENTFLQQFQVLEHSSLQTITIGAFGLKPPIMCNGANLAYTKELFNELNGFDGNDHLASGDDLFLLEKAVRDKKSIGFLKSKESIVTTFPQSSISKLIHQRVRWASKTTAYKSSLAKWSAWITLLANVAVLLLLFLLLSGNLELRLFFLILSVKWMFDFFIIAKSVVNHNKINSLVWFFISALIYPFWIVLVALFSLRKTYNWKERQLQ